MLPEKYIEIRVKMASDVTNIFNVLVKHKLSHVITHNSVKIYKCDRKYKLTYRPMNIVSG